MFFTVSLSNLFSRIADSFSTHSARMSGVEFIDNGISFIMLSATSLDTFFSKLCFNLINSSISNVGETCSGIEKFFIFFLLKSQFAELIIADSFHNINVLL